MVFGEERHCLRLTRKYRISRKIGIINEQTRVKNRTQISVEKWNMRKGENQGLLHCYNCNMMVWYRKDYMFISEERLCLRLTRKCIISRKIQLPFFNCAG